MAQRSGRPGFSSQSYTPAPSRGYPSLPSSNLDLLTAPTTKVDPQDQQAKTKEKDQMVGLNDKFVALIDKVRHLEQQNKVLETRLKVLLEQDSYKGKIDDIVKEVAENLRRQIDEVARDRQKLLRELQMSKEEVENIRTRFEDEIKKRSNLENEFIYSKKDVDEGYLQRVGLELELEDLAKKTDFIKRAYEEEIKELQSLIYNETVVVKTSNSRNLDLDEILQTVNSQYEEMASRSREEAEQWNKRKMDDLVLKAGKHEQDVKEIRKEISDIQRCIQKLLTELDSLKKKKKSLEDDIANSELDGQNALDDARDQIIQLEEALRRDKQLMARQVREYQDLMNLKLALDIEIATYRKLLEGEEMRLADYRRDQPDVKPPQDNTPVKAKKFLLVKVEVKDGRLISESSELL